MRSVLQMDAERDSMWSAEMRLTSMFPQMAQ